MGKDDLAIRVSFDKDARTVTVSDNGIGMTKDELDKQPGHHRAFRQPWRSRPRTPSSRARTSTSSASSAWVSTPRSWWPSKVRVVSRAYGSDEAWAWESDGVEGYTIEDGRTRRARHRRHPHAEGERGRHGRGRRSRVLRRLPDRVRPEEPHQALQQLRALPHPDEASRRRGNCRSPRTPATTTSRSTRTYTGAGDRELHDPHLEAQASPTSTQEEYNEFYKSDFHDFADPARTISLHAEGALDLRRAAVRAQPRALRPVQQGLQEGAGPVQLQRAHHGEVRGTAARLPATSYAAWWIPQDLTLNISRETLQHNSQLKAIAQAASRRRSPPTWPTCATMTARPTRSSSRTSAAG